MDSKGERYKEKRGKEKQADAGRKGCTLREAPDHPRGDQGPEIA